MDIYLKKKKKKKNAPLDHAANKKRPENRKSYFQLVRSEIRKSEILFSVS